MSSKFAQIDKFVEFLVKQEFDESFISREKIWLGQQPEGTAKRILESVKIIKEWQSNE